jgi:uncharacterized protein YuzE
MFSVKYDTKIFTKTMRNAVAYSNGFADGIQLNRTRFNQQLGNVAVEMLNKYIDSRARIDQDSLHHVYEWGMAGSPGGRLFRIQAKASPSNIVFFGDFLSSRSVSDTSEEPFVNKAEVMENAILVEVSPKGKVLAFESEEGETVFTTDTVYIANPGGDAVAGSFGKIIEEFFDSHFTAQVLIQTGLMKKLSYPVEFSSGFAAGASGGGRAVGINAGQKYLTIRGAEFT